MSKNNVVDRYTVTRIYHLIYSSVLRTTEYIEWQINGHFLAYIPSWWKISPGWWGWLVHAHPLSLYLPSRTKLQCTLQLRGQIHSLYFYSTPIYSILCALDPEIWIIIGVFSSLSSLKMEVLSHISQLSYVIKIWKITIQDARAFLTQSISKLGFNMLLHYNTCMILWFID